MRRRSFFLAAFTAVALVAAACGGDTDDTTGATEQREGPTITVGSADFAENEILGEIYAQGLEFEGYPVQKSLGLGSRELIFPSLENGEIDFLPEYIGSSLSAGFTVEEVPTASEEALQLLEQRFAEIGVEVLEPAPGEDVNVFVVTPEYAQEHGLENISDLAEVGPFTLGGPPECENRDTCLQGLQEAYGLENVTFQSIPESSGRVTSLQQGDIQVALMFSTQPIIEQQGWVTLEDDRGIIPPENVVPVVRTEIVDAYGNEFVQYVNSISELITTEVLLELNGRVELEAEDPDDVARDFLDQNGFLGGE